MILSQALRNVSKCNVPCKDSSLRTISHKKTLWYKYDHTNTKEFQLFRQPKLSFATHIPRSVDEVRIATKSKPLSWGYYIIGLAGVAGLTVWIMSGLFRNFRI
jgi:hypothetical protein